jgi:hypothetical protein
MTLWEKIKNEIVNPNSDLRSKIPANITQAAAQFTEKFVNTKMPPNSQKWLNENANSYLTGVTIKRAPVSRAITGFLNAVAGGRLNKKASEMGYDSLFHLSVVITFEDESERPQTAQLEKLERVSFSSRISEAPNTETFDFPKVGYDKIGDIVKKWQANMGDNFYKYDSFKNNCQSFILGFLKAADLLSPAAEKFVNQHADELLKAQPGYLGNLANSITNLGAIVNQAMQGGKKGRKGKGIVSDIYQGAKKQIMNQLDKDSFTRKRLLPLAVDVATIAQPFMDAYAPGSGTTAKAIAKGINCASNVSGALGYGKDVKMPKGEFIKEHKNLISILKSGSPKKRAREAAKQQAELSEMRGGVKIVTQVQFELEADKRWFRILQAQPIQRDDFFKQQFGNKSFPYKKDDSGGDYFIVFNKISQSWTVKTFPQLETDIENSMKREGNNPYLYRMIDAIDINHFYSSKPITARNPGTSFSRRGAHVRQTYGDFKAQRDAAAAAAPVAGMGNLCTTGLCSEIMLTPEEENRRERILAGILNTILEEERSGNRSRPNLIDVENRYQKTIGMASNWRQIMKHTKNPRITSRLNIIYAPRTTPAENERREARITVNPAHRAPISSDVQRMTNLSSVAGADYSGILQAMFGIGKPLRGGNKRSWVKHLISELKLYKASPEDYDTSSGKLFGIYRVVLAKYPSLDNFTKGVPSEAEEMHDYLIKWITRRKSSGAAKDDPDYTEKIDTLITDLERFYEMDNLSVYGVIKPEKAAAAHAAPQKADDGAAFDRALSEYETASARAEHMRRYGVDLEAETAAPAVTAAEKARLLKERFAAIKKGKKGKK